MIQEFCWTLKALKQALLKHVNSFPLTGQGTSH